jgi:hypothetical protein
MSGRKSIGFIGFASFPFALRCIRCASSTSLLVRNWCGWRLDDLEVSGSDLSHAEAAEGRASFCPNLEGGPVREVQFLLKVMSICGFGAASALNVLPQCFAAARWSSGPQDLNSTTYAVVWIVLSGNPIDRRRV